MTAIAESERGEGDDEMRQRLYAAARTELLERQFSNSAEYDKSILTLSSGFLALSLTFLKDVLPRGELSHTGLLYISWSVLAAAIVSTVMSFLLSNAAIKVQLDRAWDYYLGRDENALKQVPLTKAVEAVNATCGVLFLVGVVLTMTFVIYNFRGANAVTKRGDSSGPTRNEKGQVVPTLRRVVVGSGQDRGQPIPKLPQVPQVQVPAVKTAQSQDHSAPSTPAGGTPTAPSGRQN
jgi:hypothetical protein